MPEETEELKVATSGEGGSGLGKGEAEGCYFFHLRSFKNGFDF